MQQHEVVKVGLDWCRSKKCFQATECGKRSSAVAVVTGKVKNILVSLYTSLKNTLLLPTVFKRSAMVRRFVTVRILWLLSF